MYSTGYRSIAMMVLLLAAVPVFYWVVTDAMAYVSGATLYEGDEIETRKCRECGGKGTDPGWAEEVPELDGRCPICAGRGEIKVILPGPHRPTRVWGAVVDSKEAGDAFLYSRPSNLRMVTVQAKLLPPEARDVPGGLPNAVITFQREGHEPVTARSDFTGRFNKKLEPGSYQVAVHAHGLRPFEGKIDIQRLTEPIWLEKGTIVRELSWEEAQGTYGLALVIGMSRKSKRGEFVRLYPASP